MPLDQLDTIKIVHAARSRKHRCKKPSFTKLVMTVVILLYFLGALLGGTLVVAAALTDVKNGMPIDSAMFIAYAAYLGGPTATAIAFYAWKSKAENILKIQNSQSKRMRVDVGVYTANMEV